MAKRTDVKPSDKSLAERATKGLLGSAAGFLIGCALAALTLSHGKLTATGRQLALIGVAEVLIGSVLYMFLSRKKFEGKVSNGKK